MIDSVDIDRRPTSGDARPRSETGTALADERHKLETVIRESPAAMALWHGPELVFEMVNPVYQAIFGDLPLVEAVPELRDQGFPELLLKVFRTGEPYVGHEVLARLAPFEGAPLEDYYYDFTYVRVNDIHGEPWGVYDHALDGIRGAMSALRYNLYRGQGSGFVDPIAARGSALLGGGAEGSGNGSAR